MRPKQENLRIGTDIVETLRGASKIQRDRTDMTAGWQAEKKAAFTVFIAFLLTKFRWLKFMWSSVFFWCQSWFVRCSSCILVWATGGKRVGASYGYENTHTRINLFLLMKWFAPYYIYISSYSLPPSLTSPGIVWHSFNRTHWQEGMPAHLTLPH